MKNRKKFFARISAVVLLVLACFSAYSQTCPGGLGDVINITSLPYQGTGLSTCGKGNKISHHTNALNCSGFVWNAYGEDQVFTFIPTATAKHSIMLSTNQNQITMSLYDGCPFIGQGGSCVAFVGQENSANMPFKAIETELTAGTKYYLVVDNGYAPAGQCIQSFNLYISASPVNDNCPGAITLTPGVSCNPVNGTTIASSRTLEVPNICGGSVDDDVWYKFTATSTHHTVTAAPIAPVLNIDLLVDVRAGACDGPNIRCSYLGDNSGVTEVLELTDLTIGQVYFVRVYTHDNVPEFKGNFSVCVTTPPIAPPACLSIPGFPANGQSGLCPGTPGNPLMLSWPAQAGATQYDVFFGSSTTPAYQATVSGTSYTTSGLGTGTYYWQIRPKNAGGSASGCPVWNFTVNGNGGQQITCPSNVSVAANASCQATLATYQPSISGGCGGAPGIAQLPAAGTTLSAGATTVTLRATDGSGNTTSCNFTVTVTDQTLPTIACPANVTLNANASCQAVLASYTAAATASDNCTAAPAKTQVPAAGTTLTLGATTVTLRASDAASNSASCSFTVTVRDQTPPNISCPANIFQVAPANQCSANVPFVNATATDNCTASPTIVNLGAASGSAFSGSSSVTFRASDAAGNSATCSFTVTVADQTPPAITCPANISQNAAPNQCSAPVTFADATATDNCTASPMVVNLGAVSGSSFSGITNVTFRASDAAGNSATCSFSVTVAEITPPTITCPENTTAATGNSCQLILEDFAAAAPATDNCSASLTKTQSPVAGTPIGLGQTTVVLRATDASGNSSTCSFAIQVADQLAPAIICPANTTLSANTSCSSVLGTYTALSVSDNCAASPVVIQSPAATTVLNGHNNVQTVTLTASDGNGNTGACTFTVTLKDMTPPTITCPANTSAVADASCSSILAAYTPLAVSDNCAANPAVTQNPVAGASISGYNGAHTITLTAHDGNGNTQNCSFTITLIDGIAPTVVCKPFNAVLNTSGAITVAAADVFQSGTDNCGSVELGSVTPNTFDCSDLGAHIVTLSVHDGRGNSASCQATVTVSDQSPPTANCKNAAVYLDAAGQATLSAATINDQSSDNCSVAGISVTPSVLTCTHLGQTPVTLTVTDAVGNQASCVSIVQVQDIIAPVARCKDATLYLGSTGSVTASLATFDNGSSDNCSIQYIGITPSVFTCANVGQNIVKLLMVDAGGNKNDCWSIATVKDISAPVALCKNATIYLNASGQAILTPADVNNGSSDNCGIPDMDVNKVQFGCSQLGANTVTLKMADPSGNASFCTATVTVRDIVPPAALCQNKTVSLSAGGSVTVQSAALTAGSSDNCSISSLTPVKKVYYSANIGSNNLSIVVRDASGNASTCTSVVTVVPYGATVQLLDNGNAQAIPVQINVEKTDAPDLKVYPNPTAGDAMLEFELPAAQPYVFQLYDLQGRLTRSGAGDGVKGANSLSLETGSFMPGIYLLEFQSAAWKVSQRVVVQK